MTDSETQPTATATCYRHPDRVTALACLELFPTDLWRLLHPRHRGPVLPGVPEGAGSSAPGCHQPQHRHPASARFADHLRDSGPHRGRLHCLPGSLARSRSECSPTSPRSIRWWPLGIGTGSSPRSWCTPTSPTSSSTCTPSTSSARRSKPGSAGFRSVLLYLAAAGVGGAFAFYLGGREDVLVGASGAIFGLFGVWLHSAFRMRDTAFGRNLFSSLWISLALNMALPFFIPGISWQGHLGGLVGGVLIGEVWSRVKASSGSGPHGGCGGAGDR